MNPAILQLPIGVACHGGLLFSVCLVSPFRGQARYGWIARGLGVVWAIIINKVLLFCKNESCHGAVRGCFLVWCSLDELYATLSSRPASGMAALFVAAMREWRRSGARGVLILHGSSGAHRESPRCFNRARGSRSSNPAFLVLATVCLGGSLHRPVRHGLGHYDRVSLDCRGAQYFASGRRAGHSGGAFRDCDRVVCGDFRLLSPITSSKAMLPKKQARLEGFADEFSAIFVTSNRSAHRSRPGSLIVAR